MPILLSQITPPSPYPCVQWNPYIVPFQRSVNYQVANLGHAFAYVTSKSEMVKLNKGFLGRQLRHWMAPLRTTQKPIILSPRHQHPAYLQLSGCNSPKKAVHRLRASSILSICSKLAREDMKASRGFTEDLVLSALATCPNLVLILTVTLSSCDIRQLISAFAFLSLQNKDTDATDIFKGCFIPEK